jgi:hypothetical protein
MIYLKGTSDTCLCFTRTNLKLQGYVDADLAGNIDSKKSANGFVYTLGGIIVLGFKFAENFCSFHN